MIKKYINYLLKNYLKFKIKKLKIIKKLKNNLYKINYINYKKIFYSTKQNKINYKNYNKPKIYFEELKCKKYSEYKQDWIEYTKKELHLTDGYLNWRKKKERYDAKIELKKYRKIMLDRSIDSIESFEFDKYILLLENYYNSLQLAFIEYSNYLKKLPKVSDFDSITISKMITRLAK